jgi:hypothetical protein
MIANFDRARERGTRVGLSQNFEAYGLPGVSITLNYTKGSDAVSAPGAPLDDEDKFNVTADNRPETGLLKGRLMGPFFVFACSKALEPIR